MKSKTFTRAFLSLSALLAVLLFSFSFYLEKPVSGNLTRVGGYSENSYGWNKPIDYFEEQGFFREMGKYQKYTDVVVLGDSFSAHAERRNWVTYFSNMTELSVQVLHMNQGGIERVLNSELFISHPPKLLVVESVEANLDQWFGRGECSQPKMDHSNFIPLNLNMAPIQDLQSQDRRLQSPWEIDLDLAANFIIKTLPRYLGLNFTDVRDLPLQRDGLFSSHLSDRVLVHIGDIEKAEWGKAASPTIACNLSSMKAKAESNGYTRFEPMIVPDKLTAYSHVLEDDSLKSVSVFNQITEHYQGELLRLDHIMRKAVENGEVDLYLPSDGHWGAAGYRLAAESLINFVNQDMPRKQE